MARFARSRCHKPSLERGALVFRTGTRSCPRWQHASRILPAAGSPLEESGIAARNPRLGKGSAYGSDRGPPWQVGAPKSDAIRPPFATPPLAGRSVHPNLTGTIQDAFKRAAALLQQPPRDLAHAHEVVVALFGAFVPQPPALQVRVPIARGEGAYSRGDNQPRGSGRGAAGTAASGYRLSYKRRFSYVLVTLSCFTDQPCANDGKDACIQCVPCTNNLINTILDNMYSTGSSH
eukprot:4909739-Pyramimonas_sp.AAC.1